MFYNHIPQGYILTEHKLFQLHVVCVQMISSIRNIQVCYTLNLSTVIVHTRCVTNGKGSRFDLIILFVLLTYIFLFSTLRCNT